MSKKNLTKKKKGLGLEASKEGDSRRLDSVVLCPRLVATVGLDWIESVDLELLKKLSSNPPRSGSKGIPDFSGSLEEILEPKVDAVRSSNFVGEPLEGYLVRNTGCDYDKKVQKAILDGWRNSGASTTFLSILLAAQGQCIPKILFEKDGMIIERRQFPKLGSIPKKGLKKKESKGLLKSLKLMYEDMWPIEQLASIFNTYCNKKSGAKSSEVKKKRSS